jgi:hypothetical protein
VGDEPALLPQAADASASDMSATTSANIFRVFIEQIPFYVVNAPVVALFILPRAIAAREPVGSP